MEMIPLQAQARSSGGTITHLRASGKVPCVLYGNEVDNLQLECAYGDIFRSYVKAGESVLVSLEIGAKKVPVLFHAVQFDPVTDRMTHVDFYAVNMKKSIDAHVSIKFIGESPAVKGQDAIFVKVHDHVTVECLPGDLPHHVEVSIETLKEFGDSITVADIIVPKGVTITDDAETMIATVQEPRKEEVIEVVAPIEGAVPAGTEAAAAEGEQPQEGAKKSE